MPFFNLEGKRESWGAQTLKSAITRLLLILGQKIKIIILTLLGCGSTYTLIKNNRNSEALPGLLVSK